MSVGRSACPGCGVIGPADEPCKDCVPPVSRTERSTHAPPMTIGADDLPGVAKMSEEAGELVQVVGKLLATDGQPDHWDGSDLHARLVEEAGDMLASIRYFAQANNVQPEVSARAAKKLALFTRWHEEAQNA